MNYLELFNNRTCIQLRSKWGFTWIWFQMKFSNGQLYSMLIHASFITWHSWDGLETCCKTYYMGFETHAYHEVRIWHQWMMSSWLPLNIKNAFVVNIELTPPYVSLFSAVFGWPFLCAGNLGDDITMWQQKFKQLLSRNLVSRWLPANAGQHWPAINLNNKQQPSRFTSLLIQVHQTMNQYIRGHFPSGGPYSHLEPIWSIDNIWH